MKIAAILSAFLVLSVAHAKSAVYKGTVNDQPVVLTIDMQDQAQLQAHYIACSDVNDNPCKGPGQFAFFTNSGTSTITFGAEDGTVPVMLALYVGQEETVQGKLDGAFNFVDRTSTENKVSGITFYQDGFLGNKIQASVSGLTAQNFNFPTTYTLRWDNHDNESARQIDSGSVTLTLQ